MVLKDLTKSSAGNAMGQLSAYFRPSDTLVQLDQFFRYRRFPLPYGRDDHLPECFKGCESRLAARLL